LLESFLQEDRPEKVPNDSFRKAKHGDVTIIHIFRNNIKMFYTSIPIDPKAGKGLSLHIFYESKESNYLSQFTIELAGIILLMVILTLSLLQLIRIKVNRFRESVLRISNGDLSHRINVEGRGVVDDHQQQGDNGQCVP
jgi:methyl-accepting chemotaxis protein